MDWYLTVFETIDMRSFSNLWFWIGLAVVWSSASHWVLGVPYDMVSRAKRHGGQAEDDLSNMLRITSTRLIYIADEAGLLIVSVGMFLLTGCLVLGFFYAVEIAQAVFLLALPMTIVSLLNMRMARRLHSRDCTMDEVYAVLARHRVTVQFIGMLSIFVTALWGMYQNLSLGALGG